MASNYLKALQLTKQLEKKAQEATHNRKLAGEEIAAAEELIVAAKKMDANVAKAEAKLTEATNTLASKGFKKALELAQESKDLAIKAQENHVAMVIESTKNRVKLAKKLGIKAPDLDESLAKTDSAINEGKYEEGLEIAKKGWEELDKLLNEKVSEAFTKAQSLIVLAKKVGQDASRMEDLLDKARGYTEENDYRRALEFIRECVRQTGKMAKEEVSKLLDKAMISLELAKRMEADTKRPEELYNNAKITLDEEDYEKAIDIAKQSVAETEKILEKQSRNLVRECEDGIRKAKGINAEITKASLLLNKVRESLKNKDFEEVYDLSNQIKEEVENAQFQCVLKTISLSRPKFITAKNIGANLTEPMKFLDMARKAMKEKKFVEALDFARKGELSISKIIGDYEGAKEELQLITQALTRASKIGVDTASIADMIKEAKFAFDTKDYKKAMNLISQCRVNIENTMYEHTMKIVERSQLSVSIGEKTGSDIKKAKEYLDEAISAIKEKDYDKAMDLAKKSTVDAGEAIKKGITERIKVFITIVKSLGEVEEKNKCMKALSSANGTLVGGNYEEAYGFVEDCKNILEEHIKTSIEVADTTVASLKEMKDDASECEKMLGEAKTLFENKKYTDALSLSEKVMKAGNDQQQKIVTDIFSTISNEIRNAENLGMDVSGQVKKLTEAKEAIGRRFFKKAYAILTESKDEMVSILGKHKELSDAINSARAQLEEAREKGIDVSTPTRKLEDAEKTLRSQDFKAVSEKIEKFTKDIGRLTIEHTIKDKMVVSRRCIDIAQGLGMDISDAEMQLKKTAIYMKNRQFENALDAAKKTAEISEELCNLKISEMLSNAYSMIIEAKKIGLDVLTVEVIYQKAEESLDQGRYDKAAKYASQCLHEIEEIRDESQRSANIIHLAGNYIQEAENINADVGEAKKLLERAFSELRKNEYMASIELGKKCIRSAKQAKEQRIKDVITLFQNIIEKSKGEGMDVSRAVELLGEAKNALTDEDYNEALRLAMRSESEVEKVDLQKKMAAEVISVTAARLDEAEKNGVEVEDVRKLLKSAATALRNKEYVRALEYAMESGMELSEAAEEWERAATTIHAAQARMNESENINVVVKKARELFETAKAAFNNRNYSMAMKYAKESIREAKRSYVEHLSEPIENCEQLMKTAIDLGIDGTRPNNMLNEARAALEEESYSQVVLFTDNCKRLVEREITKHLFQKLSSAKASLAKARANGMDLTEAMVTLKTMESSLENRKYSEAANYFRKFMRSLEKAEIEVPTVEEKVAEPKPEEKVEEKPKMDLDEFITTVEAKVLLISKRGMNTKKAEGLLKEAKMLREDDPEKTFYIMEEAENALENELESFSPVISSEIDLSGINERDKWYEVHLLLTNSGKSVAKDVSFALKGDNLEVEGLKTINILKAKEKKEMPLRIKATSEGALSFILDIGYLRILDGKQLSVQASQEIQVGDKAIKGPQFQKIKADKAMKCYACNGKIKPGFMIIKCNCGNTYHDTCGERLGKCPMCGAEFKSPSAKKKVALKLGN